MNLKDEIPIALFAYARPDHLLKTLNGLKMNNVPLIYAFSDGPKDPAAVSAVSQVRGILEEIDWCEIKIVERQENLGLGASLRTGISQVFEEHKKVIVVEDDIVLRPSAYAYTVEALNYYENDPRVMTVSMWSHPVIVPNNARAGFFSKRFVCWGWGTYKNEWIKYIGEPLDLYKKCAQEKKDILSWGKDIKWQAEHAAERNFWYIGYALTHFLQDKLSYFPNESMVVNIGRDGTGENTGIGSKQDNLSLIQTPVNIAKSWPKVSRSPGLDKKFARYFSPCKRPIFYKVKSLLGKIRRKCFMIL